MKFLTSTTHHPILADAALLVVRVFIGFAMISHGFPKLQQLISGKEIEFFNFLGMGEQFTLGLAVFAEFVCSIFIILGLFTRPAVFFILITMAVAGLIVHSADGFGKKELSLVYFAIYLLLMAFGPGRFSVDQMVGKKKSSGW